MATLAAAHQALRASLAREHTVVAVIVVAYVVAGRIGLAIGFGNPAIGLVWPVSGIALGAFLVLGYRLWLVIALASLILYATVFGLDPAVLGLAAGNVAEGLLAAYLVNRYANGRYALQSPRTCLWFAGVVLLAAMVSSAVLNPLSLIARRLVPAVSYGQLWLTQLAGSTAGMLLVTPLVVQLSQGPHGRLRRAQLVEGTATMLLLLVASCVAFFRLPLGLGGFPSEMLCLPLLLWAALRLGRRMASFALQLVALVAVAGTWMTSGHPVGLPDLALGVTIFLSFAAVMTLLTAALASEYREAEEQLREMVVTDPLTGLPNYRRLLEVMTDEIAVAGRTGRPCAVVFFDLDGLKRINDEFGHVVGSRAVCRFAEVLRAACRVTDTPARYGGDEFVAVLADTDEDGARLIVRRTAQELEQDTDQPPLSVSAGVAVYPRDGATPTTLLSAADRALYAAKAGRSSSGTAVAALRGWTSAS